MTNIARTPPRDNRRRIAASHTCGRVRTDSAAAPAITAPRGRPLRLPSHSVTASRTAAPPLAAAFPA